MPSTESSLLHFDELTIGMTFLTEEVTLTQTDIIEFANAHDPQPFHCDPDRARDSLFGGLAASGWHTAALTMRLLVTQGPRLAGGIISSGGTIEWLAPTRPGDLLHVRCEVVDLKASRSRPQRGTAMVRIDTVNQRGEVVQCFTASLLVQRRLTP